MANGAEAGSFSRRGSDAIQEHELIYEKLPQDINERHVLLLVKFILCSTSKSHGQMKAIKLNDSFSRHTRIGAALSLCSPCRSVYLILAGARTHVCMFGH